MPDQKTKEKRKYKRHVFKIERGIKIPPPASGQREQYPFMQLKVGESFFIPDKIKRRKNVASMAHARVKALRNAGHKMKIVIRWLQAEKGSRIWRVK